MVTLTRSPSGSVTPIIATGASSWFGGHRKAGLAAAAPQFGERFGHAGSLSCTHPMAGSHESLVQGFESSQESAGPPTQTPLLHVSLVVQAFASLQDAVLLV
jgi:hypothetical protein